MKESSPERRGAPRFQTSFDALCAAGRREGAGILADLSRSGARVEQASVKPEIGSKVRLYVFVRPVSPFELVGEVVRITESGFAIEIFEVSDQVQQLIDDVASLVSSA